MSSNWRKELKTALKGHNLLKAQRSPAFNTSEDAGFKTVITETQLQRVNLNDLQDPIAMQFFPTADEQQNHPDFSLDPVGDGNARQDTGVIQKYHGRILLIASGVCAVNCRYCFRRHFPYNQNLAHKDNWQAVIDHIKHDADIHEVILSGGDPLLLPTKTLKALTDRLLNFPQIKTLRIHSRIPIVLPARIDREFIGWLNDLPLRKVMVLHINHSQEIGDEAEQAVAFLQAAKCTLLNQSVFLKGINDSVEVLQELSHKLHEMSILPYYLHLLDRVQNAAHFEISKSKAKSIHQALRHSLPGYLVPKLATEIAGKKSKTWLF